MNATSGKKSVPADFFIEDKLGDYDALDDEGARVWLLDRPWNRVEGDTRRRVHSLADFVDEVLAEVESADLVAQMREQNSFLVRAYLPGTPDGGRAVRGTPMVHDQVLLSRGDRAALAAKLDADPDIAAPAGAHWQMFNGRDWAPLLRERKLTDSQLATRSRVATLAPHIGTTDTWGLLYFIPLGDGLNAFGTTKADRMTTIGDAIPLANAGSWCRCVDGHARTVRFERWHLLDGLLGSGTVHAAEHCRRLVTID